MLVFGRNTVIEALKSKYEISEVILEENIKRDEKINNLINLCQKNFIKISYNSHKQISKLTKSEEHQGVACNIDFEEARLKDLLDDPELSSRAFIYISDATYEHNVGAIIRTAECAGFSGVILPTDIRITPTIAKTSTGAVFHIPIVSLSIFQTIKEFKKYGFEVIGIERDGEIYTDSTLPQNSLFIIGAEDKSLSETVRKECNKIVEIPQFGSVNSLNMSVASAVVMYEYIRQNG